MRQAGIEPTSKPWKGLILPLKYWRFCANREVDSCKVLALYKSTEILVLRFCVSVLRVYARCSPPHRQTVENLENVNEGGATESPSSVTHYLLKSYESPSLNL